MCVLSETPTIFHIDEVNRIQTYAGGCPAKCDEVTFPRPESLNLVEDMAMFLALTAESL